MAFQHSSMPTWDWIYLSEKISIDAEIAKLGLPEDRRIHAKTVDDVTSIARKILEEER